LLPRSFVRLRQSLQQRWSKRDECVEVITDSYCAISYYKRSFLRLCVGNQTNLKLFLQCWRIYLTALFTLITITLQIAPPLGMLLSVNTAVDIRSLLVICILFATFRLCTVSNPIGFAVFVFCPFFCVEIAAKRAWLQVLEKHRKGVMSVAWCPRDPDLLLSCGKDNHVYCWNPNSSPPEVSHQPPMRSYHYQQWLQTILTSFSLKKLCKQSPQGRFQLFKLFSPIINFSRFAFSSRCCINRLS